MNKTKKYFQEEKSKSLTQASSVPSDGNFGFSGATTSIPISIPEDQIKRSLSWQNQTHSPGSLVNGTMLQLVTSSDIINELMFIDICIPLSPFQNYISYCILNTKSLSLSFHLNIVNIYI